MKTGKSLEAMAAEITRQAQTRRDFKVPTSELKMIAVEKMDKGVVVGKGVQVNVGTAVTKLAPTATFHNQVGGFTKIPATYYDRMLAENPELLATNVNAWMDRAKDVRMVRTLDGTARAFLSNRYRAIDNHMIAEAVLPFILHRGNELGLRIESCEITDTRLYIKVVSEAIQAKVLGEVIQAGAVISNSEVGLHSFRVEELSMILSCLNGAIRPASGLKKYHVGRNGSDVQTAYEVFADDTRKSDDKTLMLQMRDVVKATFDGERFSKWAQGVKVTADRKIVSVEKTIDAIVEEYGLPEIIGGGILDALAKNYDATQWGLANAITLYAQDQTIGYEGATDLERIGGKILEMPAEQWDKIAA